MAKKKTRRSGTRTCPMCKAAVNQDSPHFPFCSDRCRTMDLANWARGQYVISRPLDRADLDQEPHP